MHTSTLNRDGDDSSIPGATQVAAAAGSTLRLLHGTKTTSQLLEHYSGSGVPEAERAHARPLRDLLAEAEPDAPPPPQGLPWLAATATVAEAVPEPGAPGEKVDEDDTNSAEISAVVAAGAAEHSKEDADEETPPGALASCPSQLHCDALSDLIKPTLERRGSSLSSRWRPGALWRR